MDLLRKSGAFFSYGDQRLGQGRENAKEFLKANPALRDEIEERIRATVAASRTPLVPPMIEAPVVEAPLAM